MVRGTHPTKFGARFIAPFLYFNRSGRDESRPCGTSLLIFKWPAAARGLIEPGARSGHIPPGCCTRRGRCHIVPSRNRRIGNGSDRRPLCTHGGGHGAFSESNRKAKCGCSPTLALPRRERGFEFMFVSRAVLQSASRCENSGDALHPDRPQSRAARCTPP